MVKDWVICLEDDKVKAHDVSKENRVEFDDLLKSLGFEIISYGAFHKKCDAIDYGKFILSRRK